MAFLYSQGTYVESLVTGFKGVVTGRSDFLTGCNQYLVTPSVDKDGKYVDPMWHDEHALRVDETKQQLKLDRSVDQPPG
jgi:hypothetical protein